MRTLCRYVVYRYCSPQDIFQPLSKHTASPSEYVDMLFSPALVCSTKMQNKNKGAQFQRASALTQLALESSVEVVSRPKTSPDPLDVSRSSSWKSSVVNVTTEQGVHKRLGPLVLVCVIANYISIGYLFLPWAFVQAGLILSLIGLSVISFQSYVTATYVLEACARAEALAAWAENNKVLASGRNIVVDVDYSEHREETDFSCDTTGVEHIVIVEGERENDEVSVDSQTLSEKSVDEPPFLIGHRRFEMSELCRIFLGNKLRYFFAFTAAVDLYGITWSFAIVSAEALQAHLPLTNDEDNDYQIYLLIFAVIAVTLSCIPIVDQLWIQMAFLAVRLVMVLVMVVTVGVAFRSSTSHFAADENISVVPTFDVSNLYIMLQVGIFSTAYQFSVPVMSEISNDRRKMSPIFVAACLWIFCTTSVMSIVLADFFGDSLETSSNLNWKLYHGSTGTFDEDGVLIGRARWAKVVSTFVVCFPAIDLLAVFPLIAISLGEILMGTWYGSDVHKVQSDWKRRTLFRLLASVPQIFGALFIKDISMM